MYWNVPTIVPSSVRDFCERDAVAVDDGGSAFRETEVEELRARLRDHDVAGLEIAMHDACDVRAVERVADLGTVTENVGYGERTLRDPLRERLAVEELHHEKLVEQTRPVRPWRPHSPALHVVDDSLSHVIQPADVRMLEPRDRPRLALEADLHLRVGSEPGGVGP